MSKICIYYLIKDPIPSGDIERVASNLRSDKHDVQIKFYDFGAGIACPEGCEVVVKPPEEIGNFNTEITRSLITNISTSAISILQQGCMPHKGCMDVVPWELFENPDFGSIYCDYHVKHQTTSVRTFMKSPPVDEGAPLPMVFFSTKRLAEVSGGSDMFQKTFNSFASHHIPHSLCMVEQ